MLFQDLINFFFSWWCSRRWRRMIWIAAIPALLLLFSLGLVAYGSILSHKELTNRYTKLVQGEVDAGTQEVERNLNQGPLASTSSSAPGLHVLLRRIMQFEDPPVNVVYLFAMTMEHQGRSGMAMQLLRQIAPASGGGFPLAHAWLARYNLASWKGTDLQVQTLLVDLEAAERGEVKLTAGQLSDYAAVLVKANRQQAALEMLRKHAVDYPELNLQVAQLEKLERVQDKDKNSDSGDALATGRAAFKLKRDAGTATIGDVTRAVQLEMVDNQIDRALEIAVYGAKLEPDNLDAQRLLANMLLTKHQELSERHRQERLESPKLVAKPPTLDMRYLELACKLDSTNPLVVEEIAKAMDANQQLTAEMKRAVEVSLKNGTATSLTHTLQAKRKLAEDDSQKVLQELQLALDKLPDSPMAMNNLAYAILIYQPERLSEAKQLIERALSSPNIPPAGLASTLDTLAEICAYEGDNLKAIGLFERAIALDGSKLDTRQKLASLYEKEGMTDLARRQMVRIEELSGQGSDDSE